MSQRMNHAKLNRQRQTSTGNRWYEKVDEGYFENVARSNRRWLPLGFKQCAGKTLPQEFFDNPGFVKWMAEGDIPIKNLPKDMAQRRYRFRQYDELRNIVVRIHYILPPEPDKEFVWVIDEDGVFEKIVVVGKGQLVKLNHGSHIVRRTKELDVTEVSRYKKPQLGLVRMVACVRNIYLPVRASDLKYRMEQFFEDDSNFNMAKVEKQLQWYKTGI